MVCPRCGANNFVGTPVCWRCKASLPPPEEAAGPARYVPEPAPGRLPASIGHGPQSTTALLFPIVIVVVLAGLAVLLLWAWKAHTSASPVQTKARLEALRDKLMQQKGLAPTPEDGGATDDLEARARREINRLQRQMDQTPLAPIAPGGIPPNSPIAPMR